MTLRYFVIEYVRRAVPAHDGALQARLNLLFDRRPGESKLYELLGKELRRVLAKQTLRTRITACAYVIDPARPTRRIPIPRADGGGLFLHYDPVTERITGPDGAEDS